MGVAAPDPDVICGFTKETHMTSQEQPKRVVTNAGGGVDAIYGIGMIGAWIYYFKRATTSQERALGFAKGLVWPAFLVYALLVFLDKE